jgi:hypothetical protein
MLLAPALALSAQLLAAATPVSGLAGDLELYLHLRGTLGNPYPSESVGYQQLVERCRLDLGEQLAFREAQVLWLAVAQDSEALSTAQLAELLAITAGLVSRLDADSRSGFAEYVASPPQLRMVGRLPESVPDGISLLLSELRRTLVPAHGRG